MRRGAAAVTAALLCPLLLPSASTGAAPAGTRVERDTTLQRLFDRYGDAGRGDRWTGSDSAISIPLPDGRTLWTGGDTFLGTVNPDHSRAPQGFIHNSYVVQQRDGRLGPTLFTRTPGLPDEAKIRTGDPATWYWLGDGFVEGGKLRQLVQRITGAGPAFGQVTTELATLRLPGLAVESVVTSPAPYLPSTAGSAIFFGVAVVPERDFTYVFGISSDGFVKHLHVARARTGHVLEGGWEFWSGTGWTTSQALAARVLDGVGDELSVVRTRHGWRLVASENSIGPDIYAWTAPRPEGPWGKKTLLFHTPESDAATITYNAKEHPEHHGRDWISVSYNVNARDANGLYSDVSNYRPRFLRVYLPPDL